MTIVSMMGSEVNITHPTYKTITEIQVLCILRKGFCNKFTPQRRRDKVLSLGGAGAALRGGSPDLSY